MEAAGRAPTRRPRTSVALRTAVVTMAAVIATFGVSLGLHETTGYGSGLVVLAVVLALTLARQHTAAGVRGHLVRLVVLVVVAVLARLVATVLHDHAVTGGVLLVIALSVPIALRRFGPAWTRIGTLMSLPFVAVLATPVLARPSVHDAWWAPLMAVIAYVAVTGAMTAAHALGILASPPPAVTSGRPPRRPPRRLLDPSARMAAQMAVALGIAATIGHLVFGEHWPWVVITAYVVCAGNRGRGDVLVKGLQRLAGALGGTAVATLVVGRLEPRSPLTIVLIFVTLGLGTWLRARGYAYWAAAITGVLALLQGFYGIQGTDVLDERLLGILAGGLVAVTVSWILLPVRSADVVLSRVAAVLASLQDVVGARLAGEPADLAALDASAHQLDPLRPTWRAHRQVVRRRPSVAGALDAVDECVAATRTLGTAPDRATLGAAARALGSARRRLRDERAVAAVADDLHALATLLRAVPDRA